jgi:hypothetical protein
MLETYQTNRKMAGDHLQEDDWCSLLTYSFYRGSKIASSLAGAGTYQIDRKMDGDHL